MTEGKTMKNESTKAQSIRNQYIDKKENKLMQLKNLDSKVKAPGRAAAWILGIGGSLLMGAGMSYIMVWDVMAIGLIMGISGMLILLAAYPVYSRITTKRKKMYAGEIFKLSDEIAA